MRGVDYVIVDKRIDIRVPAMQRPIDVGSKSDQNTGLNIKMGYYLAYRQVFILS